MKILFYDVLQNSNAPAALISPSLADIYRFPSSFLVTLNNPSEINCIGLGNLIPGSYEIRFFYLEDTEEKEFIFNILFKENGLYMLPKLYKNVIKIQFFKFNYTSIGRFAAGKAIKLCTGIAKEPTLASTSEPRETLSGQIISGAGGYSYWMVSLDVRYKIDSEAMTEITKAYKTQISKGFPFFLLFEEEKDRLPFLRLYANDTNQQNFSFESSVTRFLFSRRFIFKECF